jgi:uncharacterized protein
LLRTNPAVLILGPRQCGKSTLVRRVLSDWQHVDLERPADLAAISSDLEGFLEAHPRGVVFDEAQRLPDLFPALRHFIDRRQLNGRYVLLGSSSPALMRAVSETLAGRVAVLELTPFRAAELAGGRLAPERWFWGGFPPALARRDNRSRVEWLEGWLGTLLERDLPLLGYRLPAARLRVLLTMLTHVHGQLLNVSDLARSLAVSGPTIDHYLDVLEGMFVVRRLRPYFANVQKRLTKRPKVYIRDSGVLHALAGLRRRPELDTWARRGASFEGLVVEELIALAREQLAAPEFFFWRTQAGAEVDLLVKEGRRVHAFDIKLGVAVGRHDLAGVRQCMQDLRLSRGFVVANAPARLDLGRGIEIIPWRDVAAASFRFR